MQTEVLLQQTPTESDAALRANNEGKTLEKFLANHAGMPVVVVQGLGFVGAVMALVCASVQADSGKPRYAVVGVDLPNEAGLAKTRAINGGHFPVEAADPAIPELFSRVSAQGNLYTTCETSAYSHADVIIVDINLDVQKHSAGEGELQDYGVDINPLRQAIKTIAGQCREDVLVLVETTVPPGSCEKVVAPLLREGLAQRGLDTASIRVGHSYERVMPGPDYIDSIINFYRVYSGVDEASATRTETFLRTVINTSEYPLTRLQTTAASEMAKILENSYRASNIAFIEEWSRFAEEAGVNLFEVVEAIRMRPTHRNLMYPGIGVGGYCLTKDPLLASWARREFFDSDYGLEHSVRCVEMNDRTPYQVLGLLLSFLPCAVASARVLLLGVSYRGEVGDTRYTPVEPVYRGLLNNGAAVTLHDPYVSEWQECGVAVSTQLPDVISDFESSDGSRPCDAVVLCTGHREYRDNEALQQWLQQSSGMLIYDTVGILSAQDISTMNQQHTVKVIGRGDL